MRKNTIQQRLNIVRGQVQGLGGLIEKKEDCQKVTNQFYAVNAGLKKIMELYFADNLDVCLKNSKRKEKETIEFLLKEIIKNK